MRTTIAVSAGLPIFLPILEDYNLVNNRPEKREEGAQILLPFVRRKRLIATILCDIVEDQRSYVGLCRLFV